MPPKKGAAEATHAPRTGPRVRRGSAPKLLLEAAQGLFAEKGPHATTTKQIAERAKVSEDLIFRYYGSKNGLLKEAVFGPMIEMIETITPQWVAAQAESSDNAHERSKVFVGMLYDMVHENRTIAMSMVQVLLGTSGQFDDEDLHRLSNSLFEPEAPWFDQFITDRGLRRSDPKLQLRIIMILIGSVAAFLSGTYVGDEAPDRESVIEELVQFIHVGLRFPE